MVNNVKILIADDEERWRRLVGDFLRNEGYSVVEASNGQEAVELVRAGSDIHLVILDIMMPVMDGIQACQTIREFSQLPIIMLTAKNDEDSEVMGFVCGADEYISKPIKFPVFIARVKALLKRSVSIRSTVEVAGICIDPDAHTVTADGKEIPLNLITSGTPAPATAVLPSMMNIRIIPYSVCVIGAPTNERSRNGAGLFAA